MKALIVDKKKLKNNIDIIKEKAGVPVIAVIKADGYGLGMLQLAGILAENGIRHFAVTEPSDALKLRQAGFTEQKILVLRSTSIESEIQIIIEACATATVGSYDAAVFLNGIAEKNGTVVDAHIKLDTGMGRYGFLPSEFDRIQAVYNFLQNVNVTGIYTHFNSAFSNAKATHSQLSALNLIVAKLKDAKIEAGLVHAANSSALFLYDDVALDAVRIGSAITGRIPASAKNTGLQKVGYLRAQVVETRWLPKHHPIGYGASYITKKPTRIAVIPVGYTDGFLVEKTKDTYRFRDFVRYVLSDIKRFLVNRHVYVTIGSKRARVLGHVGLCHTTVDITNLDVNPGDFVTIELSPLFINPSVEKIYE